MSMCDCNQGRLPCTCKPIEGARVMSGVKRYWISGTLCEITDGNFQGHDVVMASELDRVTAERDALQERLNAADQKDDDLEFQLKDREGSRRDWFDEAQRLQAELDKRPSQIAMSLQTKIKNLQAKLAERDALLRRALTGGDDSLGIDIDTALSASAEPSEREAHALQAEKALGIERLPAEPSVPACGHPACKSLGEPHPFCGFVRGLEPSAPVEHDERAAIMQRDKQRAMRQGNEPS